jgi:hypothetical protein
MSGGEFFVCQVHEKRELFSPARTRACCFVTAHVFTECAYSLWEVKFAHFGFVGTILSVVIKHLHHKLLIDDDSRQRKKPAVLFAVNFALLMFLFYIFQFASSLE